MPEHRKYNKANNTKGTGGQNQSEEEKFATRCKDQFGEDFEKFFLKSETTPYDEYVEKIKNFLADKAPKISTSQIRNIFSLVKRERNVTGLKRIRPKLAYTYGRAEKNDSLKELIFLLDSQIKGLNAEIEVPKLKDFFEAIIAYHKYYGGKD